MSERDDRLRKLEAKLGKDVTQKLWRGAQLPKLRKHLDPAIAALSQDMLDEDYRSRKILLPPPEEPEDYEGDIEIGDVVYDGKSYGKARLRLKDDLPRHTLVIGASGSGKTVLTMRAVKKLIKAGVPVTVFDPKRSYRSLANTVPAKKLRIYTLSRKLSPFYMNPLIPPADSSITVEAVDRLFVSLQSEVLFGGLGASHLLMSATRRLRQRYPMPAAWDDHFSMVELAREVKTAAAQQRAQKRPGDWAATASGSPTSSQRLCRSSTCARTFRNPSSTVRC